MGSSLLLPMISAYYSYYWYLPFTQTNDSYLLPITVIASCYSLQWYRSTSYSYQWHLLVTQTLCMICSISVDCNIICVWSIPFQLILTSSVCDLFHSSFVKLWYDLSQLEFIDSWGLLLTVLILCSSLVAPCYQFITVGINWFMRIVVDSFNSVFEPFCSLLQVCHSWSSLIHEDCCWQF